MEHSFDWGSGQSNQFSVTTKGLPQAWLWAEERWSDRQERAMGFSQQAVEQARILVCGVNGLGRWMAEILVRKGYGSILLCDPDIVEITNLHRAPWSHSSVGEYKVVAALKELSELAPGPTELIAFIGTLQDVLASELAHKLSACLIGVDNDQARAHAAKTLRMLRTPAIFYSVSADTQVFEVFVQENGGPCWACLHPQRYLEGLDKFSLTACPKVAAIADPCIVAVGLCSYALDSLLMPRPRAWNFRQGHLHGELRETVARLQRNDDCPLCASYQES